MKLLIVEQLMVVLQTVASKLIHLKDPGSQLLPDIHEDQIHKEHLPVFLFLLTSKMYCEHGVHLNVFTFQPVDLSNLAL